MYINIIYIYLVVIVVGVVHSVENPDFYQNIRKFAYGKPCVESVDIFV